MLITGASSGIGAAFAERLAREQVDLILVARRRERLQALAKRIRQDRDVQVEVSAADLTKSADLSTVERHIAESATLTHLINNAGFGGHMPFGSPGGTKEKPSGAPTPQGFALL